MTTRHLSVLSLLFAALFITGCAGDEMPQQPNGGGTKGNTATATTTFTGETQVPATVGANTASLTTRTAATHNVVYTNTNAADKVEIKSEQTQSTPNNFDHLGESGDCGVATATGSAGNYKFTLNHKSSYLCLLPRSTNSVLQGCSLTKIEVEGDKNIAGTFTLTENGLSSAPTSDGANRITLTCGSAGFPLTNTGTNIETNGSYMVIAPGTYNLTIRYWIKDTVTKVEGTITKTLSSLTCEAGKIHDITANLGVRDYSDRLYYMWDAEKPYWYGHEWDKAGYTAGMDQPTVNGNTGSAYPKNNSDPRWYNPAYDGYGIANSGSHNPLFNPISVSHVPNANEISWYAMQGDPHWDADELWTTMGHLHKGGMWFKKHDKIDGFSSTVSADGSTDLRTNPSSKNYSNSLVSSTPLSVSELPNYFFLPALGLYENGKLYRINSAGHYWSSSARPYGDNSAYNMNFNSGGVIVSIASRYASYAAVPF
ncbi:hypothetical protein [Phocaeicola oris]|uniref:hypothetical protein n=1 Tax=Phocaeicola oris TaxID=2896850 RepID=UPI00234F20CF|nr:hypothetical protein [Phocaeicola oris]MCE2617278.1 hypothetical protein [Phocaeicola oris]